MRMYKVRFAHKSWGGSWSSRTVAVSGYAQKAIEKALSKEPKLLRPRLYVEEVILVGEED